MTTVQEEGGDHARLAIKGKRTKRQRTASPPVAAGELSEAREEVVKEMIIEMSDHVEVTTNEDEDMANCLMLLAKGRKRSSDHQIRKKLDSLSIKKSLPSASPPQGNLGLGFDGVYQCKTCDKSFHSFQALGGHRASHKKPKNNDLNNEEKKFAFAVGENRESDEAFVLGSFLSLQVTSNNGKKSDKVHECSICKAEFSSGQALGGHMRRHRSVSVNPTANANTNAIGTTLNIVGDSESSSDRISQESKRRKNFLELDLNLPAPEDDCSEKERFAFASKDQILVFAASSNSLIDCHN